MNFGEAIAALKNGAKVTRRGWNGKNMFLWLKPGTVIHAEWCHDPTLLSLANENGGTIEALPTICMKTADNKVLTGWLASQTDMLAEDWEFYFKLHEAYHLNQVNDVPEWELSEEEKVSDEDLRKILGDERFEDALDEAQEKYDSLEEKDANAEEIISDLKKKFHLPEDINDIQLHDRVIGGWNATKYGRFDSNLQEAILLFLRKDFENKTDRLKQVQLLKEQFISENDTEEQKNRVENYFKVVEDYVRNN